MTNSTMSKEKRSPTDLKEPQPAAAKGRVLHDPWSCRTCKVCEVACSIGKEGEARPYVARMNVYFDEFNAEKPITAQLCRHCKRARCIAECPTGAMGRDERTGAVIVNAEVCVGCMTCRDACPWHIPKLHPELGIAIKCDLCMDRENGPLCVEVCPLKGKALRYEPEHYVTARTK